jgi:Flp pilus assembly protein TadB
MLKAAFVHGRLTRDELSLRTGLALTARTYAELAAVTADIPAGADRARPLPAARPVHAVRAQAAPRPRRRPARRRDRQAAAEKTLQWLLGVATVAVPACIAAALTTGSKGLFSASIVLLISYVLLLQVVLANAVAARLERGDAEGAGGKLTPRA